MDTDGREESSAELFGGLLISGAFLPCKLDLNSLLSHRYPAMTQKLAGHTPCWDWEVPQIYIYLNLALTNSLGQKGPSCPVLSWEWYHVWTVFVGMQGLLWPAGELWRAQTRYRVTETGCVLIHPWKICVNVHTTETRKRHWQTFSGSWIIISSSLPGYHSKHTHKSSVAAAQVKAK